MATKKKKEEDAENVRKEHQEAIDAASKTTAPALTEAAYVPDVRLPEQKFQAAQRSALADAQKNDILSQGRAALETAAKASAITSPANFPEAPVQPAVQPAAAPVINWEDRAEQNNAQYGDYGPAITEAEKNVEDAKHRNEEYFKLVQEETGKLAEVRAANYTSFADYVKAVQGAQKKDEDELVAEEKANRKTSIWAGVGEFLNALAGLGGTFGGGLPIKTSNYASDWMKRADKNREELRKTRRANTETYARLANQLERLQNSNSAESIRDNTRLSNLQISLDNQLDRMNTDLGKMRVQAQGNRQADAIRQQNADTSARRESRLQNGGGSSGKGDSTEKKTDPRKGIEPIYVDGTRYYVPNVENLVTMNAQEMIDELPEADKKKLGQAIVMNNGTVSYKILEPYIGNSKKMKARIANAAVAKDEVAAPASAQAQPGIGSFMWTPQPKKETGAATSTTTDKAESIEDFWKKK